MRLDDIICLGCGYDLRGTTARTCPECGRGFDPGDPGTYRRSDQIAHTPLYVGLLLVALAVVFDTLTFWAGTAGGGTGWVYSFGVFCLNGLAAPALSIGACASAFLHLHRFRWRSPIAWLIVMVGAAAGFAGVWMLLTSIAAVSAV